MNLLVDPLPSRVVVGGRPVTIHTEYYVGVLFELTMQDPELDVQEKLAQALQLYYPHVPTDLAGALEAALWFYRCGTDQAEATEKGGGGGLKKSYCFEQDADLIFATFYSVYGLDLTEASDLHWWKFRALFRALPADCELRKIMTYRTADLSGLSKGERKFYEKMRRRYALQNPRCAAQSMSLAEHDRRLLELADQRFAKAFGSEKGVATWRPMEP